ncbi:leucine-rich repeat-containing 57 [Paramuricea clavata]|nr:leucine-rich repeat-containing 57 [Paramuricea clavata]
MSLAPTVRTMDLSKNQLTAIPVALGNFTELKQLNAEHNEIGNLPNELTGMKKLENLQLGYNRIQEIPSSYSKFKNLKSIYIQNNKLTIFPICLCELRHLDVIDLSENKIQELPENSEKLQCIELNMNMNQLKGIPASLSLCPRLKVLRAEENLLELASITSEFLKNSQVCVLAVDGNLFQMKDLSDKDGYDKYMERYTASKKKFF